MSRIYGGNFQNQRSDLSNGNVNAMRVNDNKDQVYQPGKYRVEAMAKFADADQKFGYKPRKAGGRFIKLFESNGFGYDHNKNATVTVTVNRVFRWARRGPGGTFTSGQAGNPGNADHVVTYEMDGGSSGGSRMIFFEDLAHNVSDHDYQDLIVRMTRLNNNNNSNNNNDNNVGDDSNTGPDNDGSNNDVTIAPTPGAAGAGLALLVGSVLLRRTPRSGRGRGGDR